MKTFADLLDRLVYTPSRNGKLRLLARYYTDVPDPDRGWALAALTGDLKLSLPMRRIVRDLMEPRVDPVLYQLSRDYVGDTAETVALLWPGESLDDPPRLKDVVETLQDAAPDDAANHIENWLNRLDTTGRWALLKLVTGALRVGVSSRLAKISVANWGDVDIAEIEELWHGLTPPFDDLFAWLGNGAPKPQIGTAAVFRPLMLAHPLEKGDIANLTDADFLAEWKWDGIRVQLAARESTVRLFSRTGDEISHSFPEIIATGINDVVLDGELLVVRDGTVAPFNDLQQRLNRKSVTKRMLSQFPAHIRLYDILIDGDDDLRPLPLDERRASLEAWHARTGPSHMDVSDLIAFENIDDLGRLRDGARASGIEGLMLKRRSSPYIAGRPKGHWFKWKRAPLTIDTVLMYAQRGSGKRSSFYSDFTFGAWTRDGDGKQILVPVGKAYFGFTDEELKELDRWVRSHTTDRYGPVRAVEPKLVVEVAFDAVHLSKRHKSGVAMRFPRIHRIRWDKPAHEAEQLTALTAMIE